MKKTLFTLIILISCLNISHSQGQLNNQNRFSTDLNGVQNFVESGVLSTTIGKENPNIKGSPYITTNFIPANISVSTNQIFSVKYNAFLDEFEVLGKDDVIYAINKNESKDVTIIMLNTKKKYQVFNYFNSENDLDLGYFIHLNNPNSEIKLLKKEKIIFISEKLSSTGYDKAQPAEYKRSKDKFYLKIRDLEVILLPKNKKKLTKLFLGSEKEILNFIKTEKIKLNKETDLVKLINYLNQIRS
ncbi:MAG: hypothetical protein L3J25_05950 [Flavobacteriaceae bacterium]|nr:hypothetical protein [Flavobacteriaceae bacterium]